ncbi:MAG: Uma2 family endonuclease [Planctomycetaceae bacterium]|nr:Uma2 family endonuclease [Planctomycetaceae bacterium]
MSTVLQPPVTIADFERMPEPEDGSKLELVRGEVVVMPPAKGKHGICCSGIAWILMNFVKPAKLGWVTTNDTGVVLERGPDTVRGPDVAFWSITRQPTMPEGYFEIPPDIAVEVLSPNDRRTDVRVKIKEYVFYSVPLVWLVDPETRTVLVYRGSMRGTELDENDTLDGGDVLPGFSCKVADLFA